MSTQVIIIGSGFGGLCMAIRLKQAGIGSFVVLEKAASLGGTWRDNTYPGAACDVQSHLYSYSFEPKHDWSRKFGRQAEIHAYMEHCADKYGVRPHIRFGQDVAVAEFDDATAQWRVRTTDGTNYRAAILITALGQLNRPALPDIRDREAFRGTAFHSARWNHGYDLHGKTVAVIGTGASAIQFVPQIVPQAAKLYLFQRSAAWVVPKPDRRFARVEKWLFAQFPPWDRIYRAFTYWKNESRALGFTRFRFLLRVYSLLAHWHRWRQVRDRRKRALLKPDYPVGCKRVLISDDYYPAVDQPQVEIVSADIERFEADGIVTADGRRWPVDAIIYGTGFASTGFLAPIRVRGTHGLELDKVWHDGAEAYQGIAVAGFPNLFLMYGPNTNLAHNSIIFMLEAQAHYILQAVRLLLKGEVRALEVRRELQSAYNRKLQQRLAGGIWDAGCTSWYKTASGKITNNWPGFTFSFRAMLRRFEPADYEVRG